VGGGTTSIFGRGGVIAGLNNTLESFSQGNILAGILNGLNTLNNYQDYRKDNKGPVVQAAFTEAQQREFR
jgi:hypothetical protein